MLALCSIRRRSAGWGGGGILATVFATVLSFSVGRYARAQDPEGSNINISGTYELFLPNRQTSPFAYMRITEAGSTIYARGLDQSWTGTGRIDGRQGYYIWKFADGAAGRTDFKVNQDGSLLGHVQGQGVNLWYTGRALNPGTTSQAQPATQGIQSPPTDQSERNAQVQHGHNGTSAPTSGHKLVYKCAISGGGNAEIIVDLVNKTVSDIDYINQYKCEDTVVNGAVGPISSPELCNVPIMNMFSNKMSFRQIVMVDGDEITWKGITLGGALYLSNHLNLSTGHFNDNEGNIASCARVSG